MDQDGPFRCESCPAFAQLPGGGDAGTCRSAPPVVLQGEKYFRGSTRELPFGAFPSVGAFPLVRHDDWCMAHPKNRAIQAR
jgi:hypothetical protein